MLYKRGFLSLEHLGFEDLQTVVRTLLRWHVSIRRQEDWVHLLHSAGGVPVSKRIVVSHASLYMQMQVLESYER